MNKQMEDKRRESTEQEDREKEDRRLKRLGWTYVQVTGFSNRKMRRQIAHGPGMYMDKQEGVYRQNG